MNLKHLAASVMLVLASCGIAQANEFPNKPVRIFVPYGAGGSTDVFIRMVAERLSDRWKQPVIVENRPAGNTVVASYDVTQAPADGYTLGIIQSAFIVNPGIRSNLPYDTLNDFSGVSYILEIPAALTVHKDYPANTLDEFIEHAKKETDPVLVASSGVGTIQYLLMLLAAEKAGFEVELITYNGSADAISNVLSGVVPVFVDAYSFVKPYIESGDLKVLGFFTEERLPDVQDIPTFQENYPGIAGGSRLGFKVRAGTPQDIIEKISKDIQEVVTSPEMSAAIRERGAYPMVSTPQETDADLAIQVKKWTDVANAANIRID